MSLTSEIKQFYYKPLPGMNNKIDPLEMGQKYVKKAQNVRFDEEPGSVTKRERLSYFNSTTLGSGAALSAYRYYTSGGVKKWIVIHDTTAYVGDDSAGTFTSIRTGLTSGKKCTFVTYKDLLYVSNGYDNIWIYDGASDNVTWEMGSCKGLAASGGSLDASADYKYQVTIDADAYICGAVSNTIATTAVNKKIELTEIPLGPAGTANRKIYRTEGDGSTYKLLTTIADNTTTVYTDSTADASLGATMGGVTDDVPLGTELKTHRERLFITRDPSNPNRIYYSNPYLPHYIQQTTNLDYMDIEPDDNDEIMGIPLQLGMMCCIKKNSIRKLHITSPVSGTDPTTWYADDPIVHAGCPAEWTIQQSPYGIIYLGWDHWYVFNGATSLPIIDEFDTNDILSGDFLGTVGYYDPKGIFMAAYTDATAGAQQHDRVMRYNFKRKAMSFDSVGVECFASKAGDDENGELYYGDSANGYIYKTVHSEITHQLRTKTECNAGTKTDIFVGGTESSPYIEIGSVSSASAIPDDICVLWDDAVTTPGTGWTEVTTLDEMFVKIDDGAIAATAGINVCGGSETALNYIDYRLFKKNNTTTEYTFPDGAIVMWDQSSNPAGYTNVSDGYHVRINSDTDYTGITGTVSYFPEEEAGVGEALDNWVEFRFIKKVGEQNTWDGQDQYVYCLYYNTAAPGNDWTDVSSTYDNYFLKTASNGPTTQAGGDTSAQSNFVRFDSSSNQTSFAATSGSNTYFNTEDEVIDNDIATYYYAKCHHSHDGNATVEGTSTHTWDTPRTVDSIYVKMRAHAQPMGNYATGSIEFKIEWRDDDGNWTAIHDTTTSTQTDTTETLTYSAGYANCTGVRAYCKADAYSYEGDRQQFAHLYFYEIKATGDQSDYGTLHIAKKILGKMQDFNAAILAHQGTGTWTSLSAEVNAESLNKLYWNETLTGTDNALFYTRVGATQAACEAAAWSASLTDPNGTAITSTADVWIQYKVDLTAADTTNAIPRIYFTDGYVVKLSYTQAAVNAEDTVEFIYQIGVRNFDLPMADKIFKKIATRHEGTQGSFTVDWETENSSGSFLVDLQSLPKYWDSFFPDDAMGREIDITVYKNDAYSFKLKEIQGAYTAEPILI